MVDVDTLWKNKNSGKDISTEGWHNLLSLSDSIALNIESQSWEELSGKIDQLRNSSD